MKHCTNLAFACTVRERNINNNFFNNRCTTSADNNNKNNKDLFNHDRLRTA